MTIFRKCLTPRPHTISATGPHETSYNPSAHNFANARSHRRSLPALRGEILALLP